MTTIELAINIIIISLLIPAIYYAARLSRNLSKLEQNQQKMAELAQALKLAVDTFEHPTSTTNSQSTDIQQPAVASTDFDKESPSEAELELLQALRSIK